MVDYKCQYGRLDFSHLTGRILLAHILVQSPQAAPEGRIEMILDIVVRTAREVPCKLFPLITTLFVHLEESYLLLGLPLALQDGWIEVVVPSLPALFACSLLLLGGGRDLAEKLCITGPVLAAVLGDDFS